MKTTRSSNPPVENSGFARGHCLFSWTRNQSVGEMRLAPLTWFLFLKKGVACTLTAISIFFSRRMPKSQRIAIFFFNYRRNNVILPLQNECIPRYWPISWNYKSVANLWSILVAKTLSCKNRQVNWSWIWYNNNRYRLFRFKLRFYPKQYSYIPD